MVETINKQVRATRQLMQKLGREPTPEEIAEEEAAERLIALVNDRELIEKLRSSAYRTATEKFMTVDRRFGMEAQLIMDTAQGKDTSKYPKTI